MRVPGRPILSSLLVAAAALLASMGEAQARKVEDVFAGRIVISKSRFPGHFASQGAFVAHLKKVDAKTLWPERDGGRESDKWKFEYMSFFRQPLDDLEVKVKFFDITAGTRRFVSAFEQYTSARGERILASNITLERPEFEINKKYMMVVESRGRVLASTSFVLRGSGPHYSGRVEFTDDETTGRER